MRSLSDVRESILWILKLLFERQLTFAFSRKATAVQREEWVSGIGNRTWPKVDPKGSDPQTGCVSNLHVEKKPLHVERLHGESLTCPKCHWSVWHKVGDTATFTASGHHAAVQGFASILPPNPNFNFCPMDTHLPCLFKFS